MATLRLYLFVLAIGLLIGVSKPLVAQDSATFDSMDVDTDGIIDPDNMRKREFRQRN